MGFASVDPAAAADPAEVEDDEAPDSGLPRRGGQRHRIEAPYGWRATQQDSLPEVQAEQAPRGARGGRRVDRCRDALELAGIPERLRADDHAGCPLGEDALGLPGCRRAGIEPDAQPRRRDCAYRPEVIPTTGDRIEVGDIALTAAEPSHERPRQVDRVGRRRQNAARGRIAGALPAYGVHRDTVLEIQHRDDAEAHARSATPVAAIRQTEMVARLGEDVS